MFHPCKVTVVARNRNAELIRTFVQDPDGFLVCDQVEDDQEFIIDNPYVMPKNICAHAWADIRAQILAIASGGTFAGMKNPRMALATCTDPFRPVIFKIERMEP